ncbi:apoptosis-inducing factor 2 [Entomortierella parvispora]|uniref:Apoptosis-inducing factor 2 n=1 Tax=Entomortierella parvispora TaxID=205924 RepID=A0A9P3LSH5_9FUNG|nr:apoptosis-inducing factor 2 [Entomortierella parvispora]
MPTKHIVIVGGSYGGVACANTLQKALDPRLDATITLIDSRDARYHCIASYRALVQKDYAKNLWIPYTNLFPKNSPHRVIQGVVSGVYHDHVILSTNSESSTSRIDFDYLVIATGSMVPSPSKWKVKDSAEGRRLLDKAREDVEHSQSIVVIGGGACGTELAGELKYAYPAKKVTLIHGGASLVDYPKFPQSFKDEAKRYLEKQGVEVILNEQVEVQGLTRENSIQKADRTIVLKNTDRSIRSDLQFLSIGQQAQTELLSTLQLPSTEVASVDGSHKDNGFKVESLLDPKTKAIRVRSTLQLDHAAFLNIFAIGDASNADPVPTAMAAVAGGETSARNIMKLIKKARRSEAGEREPQEHDGFHCHSWSKLEDYRHIQTLMILAMNPSGGVCQLPVLGTWFGNLGAWLVKSGDLFSGRFWREMNMPRR